MAERLNALVLKTSKGATPSRVRIPVSPPLIRNMHVFNPFSINKPKFLDILGFSDFNLDKDNKTLELKFNASVELTHSNDTIVQGGFVTAMLDSCMAQLVLASSNGQVNPLTLDINVQFLRPCTVGDILVRAKYIKDGRTIAYTSAELFQNEKIVASATATSKLV